MAAGLYMVSYMVFEFWLGKTEKTRAGSSLEMLLIGIGSLIGIDLVLKLDKLFTKGK